MNVENVDAEVELSQIEELKHITVIIMLSAVDADRNCNHVSRAWIPSYVTVYILHIPYAFGLVHTLRASENHARM